MHHCDVLCLSHFSLQAYNYTEHLYFCALNSSPPTHFTRAPPSPHTWTAGWWSSMQVSWQQSYSTRSRVQDVRRSRLQNRDCMLQLISFRYFEHRNVSDSIAMSTRRASIHATGNPRRVIQSEMNINCTSAWSRHVQVLRNTKWRPFS